MSNDNVDSLASIENIQYQAQELSGIDDTTPKTIPGVLAAPSVIDSFPSVPALRVNVPEIQDSKATFKYNFFVPDEREVINNDGKIIDVSVSRSDEIFFQMNNDRMSRYVELSFKPPKKYSRIGALRNSNTVSLNLDKILVEGGSNSSDYTSFELLDTGAEKQLYDIMNGALLITEVGDTKDSPQDGYNKLLEAQKDGSVTGEEKKLIASALKGIQSKGYTVAASDTSPEVAETAGDLTSRQNFSMQMHNLVFDQVIKSGLRIPDSIFQDEYSFITTKSSKISAQAKVKNSSNSMSEKLYTTQVKAIEVKQISQEGKRPDFKTATKSTLPDYSMYPEIKHAGYIIKKLEVLENDAYADRGYLVSDNPDGLFIVDKNVRYGGVYVYEIRSIYQVKMIAETRVQNDASLDTVSIVTALIASEGSSASVSCFETVPPPPPTNLNISFDNKTRKPFVSWQFPINPQRDIKRFQIFKRHSVSEPFTLITEYDFDNSTIKSSVAEKAQEQNLISFNSPRISFTDNTWQSGQKPIYAIACVDAHGLSSNFSAQMQFEYIVRLNKVKNTLVSYPNAPKPYPNILLNRDSFQDAMKVSGYDRMKVFLDPEYYKVSKSIKNASGKVDKSLEQDLNFISINAQEDTYKIHILNLDLQKDKILNIRIGDFSGSPLTTVGMTTYSFDSINL